MWRKIFLFLGKALALSAAEVNIYALNAKKDAHILTANDDVVIFSDLYFITAKKAIYNEKTGDIELFNDVNILRGQNERSHSNYAKINLNTHNANFEDFFFANSDLEVWFQSQKSCLDDKTFQSYQSSVSSCNVDNPDWQIKFSQGRLNRKNNFVHLYNARLYIKDVPIFYLPYFGFSTDTERKTGLLVPEIAIKSKEGLYYEQPIYITMQENWDLQLNPQLRSNRGYGLYSTIRFIDSPHSMGELHLGAFREKKHYRFDQNLKHRTHKGTELKYLREDLVKFLLGDNFQEGLWIDATYLNDVDYLNLSKRDYKDLNSLITSKINYFLADENNFYGAYAKHYIDTSKLDNKDTLQNYPSLQYHRFLNAFFDEKIRYSFDVAFNNYYRSVGPYANSLNFTLPLSYHNAFFDEFLQFTFTERISASFVNYSHDPDKEHEHYYRNIHELSLYTDLAKSYAKFFHTLSLGINYIMPGESSGAITKFYLNLENTDEQINPYIVQYFYNENSEKKVKHRLDLNYYKDNSVRDLKNLFAYYPRENILLNNELIYSYTDNRFSNIITQAQARIHPQFNVDFSHAYQNDSYGKYSFIGTKAHYLATPNYNIFGGLWLDVDSSHTNRWELGYSYQRKCWNYSLAYREKIDPRLTSGGISARNQSGIYFSFNFYPLGGASYDFSLQESENAI